MTNQTTLPILLRAEALGEIMANLTSLFMEVSDDLPSDETMDMIVENSALLLDTFTNNLSSGEFDTPGSDAQAILGYQVALLHALIIGVRVETARQIVDHVRSRMDSTTPP